jgi:NitT/TauT family transport system permease protein
MSVTTSNGAITRSRGAVYSHESALQNTQTQCARSSPWRVPVVILPWLLALVFLIGWYIATSPGRINSLILPAPADVLSSLVEGITSGLYLNNALVTIQESIFGFLLAVIVALPLGYGLAKSRILAATFQPYLAAGQAIPTIVIAPLLMLWLGYGTLPIMLVCALVVLFPMVINTIFGIRSIDQTLTDAARVEGATGWPMLAHIEFPLALPAILAAIRTCFTLSITGALVGEFVAGGDQGLGTLVLIAKNQYNTSLMFSTLVVLAVLATIYYGATWLLVKLAEMVY